MTLIQSILDSLLAGLATWVADIAVTLLRHGHGHVDDAQANLRPGRPDVVQEPADRLLTWLIEWTA